MNTRFKKIPTKSILIFLVLLLLSQVALACGEQSPTAKIPPTVLTKAKISLPQVSNQSSILQPLQSVNLSGGHIGLVASAFWSADGTRIISMGVDKTVRVFDPKGTQLGLMHHSSSLDFSSLALSNNGKLIASGSVDGTIMLWDAANFQLLKKLEVKTDYETAKIIFTPDDKYLITINSTGYNGSLLVDLNSGLVQTLVTGLSLTAFTGNSKSDKIVFGSYNGSVKIWDYTTRKFTDLSPEKLGFKEGQITGLAVAADGTELIGVIKQYPKYQILRWNFQTQTAKLLPYEGKAKLSEWRYVKFIDAYQNLIAVCNEQNEIVILDRETGAIIKTLKDGKGKSVSVEFNPTNGLLLSGTEEGILKVWDTTTGSSVQDISGENTAAATVLAISGDNKLFAGGFADGTVKAWEVASGKQVLQVKAHERQIAELAFSPDSNWLASATGLRSESRSAAEDNNVKIWSVAQGKLFASYDDHKNTVTELAFTGDSKQLFSTSFNKDVLVYDLDKKTVSSFTKPSDVAFSMVMSHDNKLLGLHTRDDIIRVYDLQTKKEVFSWKNSQSWSPLAFSWDSKNIFVQAPTLTKLAIFDTATPPKTVIQDKLTLDYFGVSKDDKYVLTIDTHTSTLGVWNIDQSTKKTSLTLPVSVGQTRAAALSKDGGLLALSPSRDSRIDIFSVTL